MVAYEPVIGLEVHAQLLTRTKLFCSCSTAYGDPPNSQVCMVCLGLPGALPVLNKRAVTMAVRAGLALGCKVRRKSVFARKNYFYPDLAKGYQISQYELPFNEEGQLSINVDGKCKTIGITRIHMEEDAAKNIHQSASSDGTLVNFNRAGVPLIEIVSEPDLRSSEEAEAYLRALRDVLMFMGVNDGNLEEGSFRCDANVSIRRGPDAEFGTRVELKNINSFRFVRKAIDYEIARQEAVLNSGGTVVMETRTWSEGQGETLSMRGKEEAHDYRYFPDPDLPPLMLDEPFIADIKQSLPKLPQERRAIWEKDAGLSAYDAQIMASHPAIADFFDQVTEALTSLSKGLKKAAAGKKVANFIQSEVLRYASTAGLVADIPVQPKALAELLHLVEEGTISGKMAKSVFGDMIKTGKSAQVIVDAKGLAQLSDAASIDAEVQKVLDAHPAEVEKFRAGKETLFGFFVGQVMKATRGSANPKMVNASLQRLLKSQD